MADVLKQPLPGKLAARPSGAKLRPEDLTFEEARAILERASDEAKRELARSSNEPEVLAYLSRDLKGEVRALVASNIATPREIDHELAGDELAEVRIEIARKIARLLPDLREGEAEYIRDQSLKVIERLAADELPRVRQIVAEEIKSSPLVPRRLVVALAHDAESAVAAPVLEYSPLLSDDDLLEIIATSKVDAVLFAIARRRGLGELVADAVVASLDVPAVTALLANPSAKIRKEALENLAEHARDIEAWHQPLVLRPELSMRAIRRISGFVASSLLDILGRKHDLDDETRKAIVTKVRERLNETAPSVSVSEQHERIWAAVSNAASAKLDDEFVIDAIKSEDRLRCMLSLVALGRVPEAIVERILKSGSAPLITALAWHAGLQMRTAFELQKSIAKLSPSALLPARGGMDYPLSPEQMISQLSVMGIDHRTP